MLPIQIREDVLSLYPEAEIRIVVTHGLDNGVRWTDVEDRLNDLESEVADRTWSPFDENDPHIASWHDAFRLFGTDPRRSR